MRTDKRKTYFASKTTTFGSSLGGLGRHYLGLLEPFFTACKRDCANPPRGGLLCRFFLASSLFAVPAAVLEQRIDRLTGRRRPWREIPRRFWAIGALGGASDAICSVLFFAAMNLTTLAVANLTHYLSPLIVAMTAPWLTRTRYRSHVIIAVIVALVGMVLLLEPWATQVGPHFWMGAGVGALSAVFFALQILAGKRSSEGLAPALNLASQRVVATALLAPTALLYLPALTLAQWGYLLVGGMLINGVAGAIFFAGLARSRADLAAGLTLLEPVSAVVIGFVVWHEPIGLLGLVGIVMVLLSVGLCQHEEDVRPPRPAPSA